MSFPPYIGVESRTDVTRQENKPAETEKQNFCAHDAICRRPISIQAWSLGRGRGSGVAGHCSHDGER